MNAIDLIDSELANHHQIIEDLEANLKRFSDDPDGIKSLIKEYRYSLDRLLRDQRLLMEAEIKDAIKEVPLFSIQAH